MKWFGVPDNTRLPVFLKEPSPSPFVQPTAPTGPTSTTATTAKATPKPKAAARSGSSYAALVKRNKAFFDKYSWAEHLLK